MKFVIRSQAVSQQEVDRIVRRCGGHIASCVDPRLEGGLIAEISGIVLVEALLEKAVVRLLLDRKDPRLSRDLFQLGEGCTVWRLMLESSKGDRRYHLLYIQAMEPLLSFLVPVSTREMKQLSLPG